MARKESITRDAAGGYAITIPGYAGERFDVRLTNDNQLHVKSLHRAYSKSWELPASADRSRISAQHLRRGLRVSVPLMATSLPIQERQQIGKHRSHVESNFKPMASSVAYEAVEMVQTPKMRPGWLAGWQDPEGMLINAPNATDMAGVEIVEEDIVECYPKSTDAFEGYWDTRGQFRSY